MNDPQPDDLFKTSDLALAASLSLIWPIVKIGRENPKRAEFYFAKAEKLDAMVIRFWQGKVRVNPVDFYNSIRSIKARIHD